MQNSSLLEVPKNDEGFPGGSDGRESACSVGQTWVWLLGWKDLLEEGTAAHSRILAWRIPWTEEPGGHSPGSHKELDTTERLGTAQEWWNSDYDDGDDNNIWQCNFCGRTSGTERRRNKQTNLYAQKQTGWPETLPVYLGRICRRGWVSANLCNMLTHFSL